MGRLTSLPGPELIFGLVGAVGTDLKAVQNSLRLQLAQVRYQVEEIHVSSLLHQVEHYSKLREEVFKSEYDRILAHMRSGTELRETTGSGDIMALLAISAIRKRRIERQPDLPKADAAVRPLQRTAFVIRSLKHPEEIHTLRLVYGRAFNLISSYSPKSNRLAQLAMLIAESRDDPNPDQYRSDAEKLILIDEQEDQKLGQNVREAFPLGDLFVDARSQESLSGSLSRFVQLLFGHPFKTPTRDEFAMFHAYAAALRSADLGRQVGVAITNDFGNIISVGCNDVPKVGGGLFWGEEQPDFRDFVKGYDSTSRYKRLLIKQTLAKLQQAGWRPPENQSSGSDDAFDVGLLKGTQVHNLLEFGRSVHAEMSALSEAAHRGVSVRDGSLYSTTFPCHLCARHIISSGIRRVVYIEPYPKSLARILYEDMIEVDPRVGRTDRVTFEPFVGVAPSIYVETFRAEERKDPDGNAITWINSTAEPKLKQLITFYLMFEERVLASLPNALARACKPSSVTSS